jgi:hypothetical protein
MYRPQFHRKLRPRISRAEQLFGRGYNSVVLIFAPFVHGDEHYQQFWDGDISQWKVPFPILRPRFHFGKKTGSFASPTMGMEYCEAGKHAFEEPSIRLFATLWGCFYN